MLDKYMRRFSDWFASPAGVLETFIVTIGVVIIEHIFPRLDPNGFLLLYWLTVYSGVTQNILAYASNVSADKSETVLMSIQQLARIPRPNASKPKFTISPGSNRGVRITRTVIKWLNNSLKPMEER